MKLRTNQSGFSFVEVIIVLVVLGLIGFIGYNLYTRQANKTDNATTNQSAAADDVSAAPEVDSTNDLDKASATLDQADTSSGNDSAELDTQLQAF